jgi:hypothetical protein
MPLGSLDPADFVVNVTATAPRGISTCPASADAWQTSQNAYCADEYGWPLRPDGSVMTREDIEANARAMAIKQWWPYAAGSLILLLLVTRNR